MKSETPDESGKIVDLSIRVGSLPQIYSTHLPSVKRLGMSNAPKRAVSSSTRRSHLETLTAPSAAPRQFTIYSPRSPESSSDHLAIYQPSTSSSRVSLRSETPILLSDGSLCVCREIINPSDSETSPNQSSETMHFPIDIPYLQHPRFPIHHPPDLNGFRRAVTDIPRAFMTSPLAPLHLLDTSRSEQKLKEPRDPNAVPYPITDNAPHLMTDNASSSPQLEDTAPQQIATDAPSKHHENDLSSEPTLHQIAENIIPHQNRADDRAYSLQPHDSPCTHQIQLPTSPLTLTLPSSPQNEETPSISPIMTDLTTKSIALDNVLHTSPREQQSRSPRDPSTQQLVVSSAQSPVSPSPGAVEAQPLPSSFLRSFVSELAQDVSPPIFSPRRHTSANDSTASTVVPAARNHKARPHDPFAFKQKRKQLPLYTLVIFNCILTLALIYIVSKVSSITSPAQNLPAYKLKFLFIPIIPA